MMLKLNLPKPSKELYAEIWRVANDAGYDWPLKAGLDKINRYEVNSITHVFPEDSILNELTIKEYQEYFQGHKLIPSVGVLRNTEKDRVSCFPPHGDRTRIFALNFYIQKGGKDVQTVFYDKHISLDSGPGTGEQFRYDQVEVETVYRTKMDTWYALNVRQIHSVENIETIRIIYTISFHHFNMVEFVEKYHSYIQVIPEPQFFQ